MSQTLGSGHRKNNKVEDKLRTSTCPCRAVKPRRWCSSRSRCSGSASSLPSIRSRAPLDSSFTPFDPCARWFCLGHVLAATLRPVWRGTAHGATARPRRHTDRPCRSRSLPVGQASAVFVLHCASLAAPRSHDRHPLLQHPVDILDGAGDCARGAGHGHGFRRFLLALPAGSPHVHSLAREAWGGRGT